MPKISELPLAGPLTGAETLPLVQNGQLKRADVIAFVQGAAAEAIEDAVQQVGEGVMTSGAFTMNSGRLLGRTSPDAGRVEEITVGAGLALVDGILSAEGDSSAAPLESPAFTGNPTAPTPTLGDNDTSIATTAFVQAAIAAFIAGAPGALDTINELAAALGNDANFAATVTNALALRAPIASPAFTGNPTAPTPTLGDNDTSIATTAFVQAELMPSVVTASTVPTVNPYADPAGNDGVTITALATNTTIMAPTGTPPEMRPLIFRIKDNGSPRTLTWNAIYRAIGVTLPTTTAANKTLYVGFLYNATEGFWDCVLVRQQA